MQVCTGCGIEKPLTAFNQSGHPSKPYKTRCKDCENARRRAHRPKVRDHINARQREYYQSHKRVFRNNHLRRYGITLKDYDSMFAAQGGVCAVCGEAGDLVVDHDHTTREVRALLCVRCNCMIGYAREDPTVLAAGIEYLTGSFRPVTRRAPYGCQSRNSQRRPAKTNAHRVAESRGGTKSFHRARAISRASNATAASSTARECIDRAANARS